MILTVTLNTSIDKFYLVPAVTPETVMRVSTVNNTAGGKGMNVSRIAALAGESVTAMGFVGGHMGAYFESLITEKAISKAFTHVQTETRSCINVWDQNRSCSTEYLEPGAPITQEDFRSFVRDFQQALPNASVVTISGSMPKGTPADAYSQLIALCREACKPVILDTSGETLKNSIAATPTMIKPNMNELGQLLGCVIETRDEAIDAALSMRSQGIARVVISMGADGAIMADEEGLYYGRPPHITPVNTVGCGDSMVGGFAVGYARGMSSEDSLRFAIAVSTANAMSMKTGDYDPLLLQEITSAVNIEKIC